MFYFLSMASLSFYQLIINPLKASELILYGGEFYNGQKVNRSFNDGLSWSAYFFLSSLKCNYCGCWKIIRWNLLIEFCENPDKIGGKNFLIQRQSTVQGKQIRKVEETSHNIWIPWEGLRESSLLS